MIIKSRITGQKSLDIFENFIINSHLPKFKTENENRKTENDYISTGVATFISNSSFIVNDSNWISIGDSQPLEPNVNREKSNTKKSFFQWFLGLFKKDKNVIKVFNQIFENLEQLKEFQEREDHINAALVNAEKNGQTALSEKIKKLRIVHLLESQLIALKFVKVIDEQQIIKFAHECEKGLRLDWIKNFTRVIPATVIEKKIRADELKLFDNYVILHYDPDNTSNQLTNEEVEKKKDPILFGVFKESRKLYYIDDWIDEHCNLTFNDLIEKIGEENLTIKKEIL